MSNQAKFKLTILARAELICGVCGSLQTRVVWVGLLSRGERGLHPSLED